jgi:hypothetical protein
MPSGATLLQDSNVVRLMPAGPDGRELPPLQPGAEPPPAVLPAYEYASRNMQSSYAPPLETVRASLPLLWSQLGACFWTPMVVWTLYWWLLGDEVLVSEYSALHTQGGKHFSQNARDELGRDGAASVVPGGGEDGKSFIAPAFTKTYDMEAKVGPVRLGAKLLSAAPGLHCGTAARWRCQRVKGNQHQNLRAAVHSDRVCIDQSCALSMHSCKRHPVASSACHRFS